ncbi:MAG: hypothetical protein ETSY1_41810 [Candidatus Entotheonella factor]|uniref:Cyclic phosphodiesterase-like protein n=1 Tax=Entotheonella factor TaxID=1429438 RepID=W4L485_ENTF1|nr:MAG: hypothetical protein ETSY1_41810 [Candidatus Entotheonella factor]
MKYFFWLLPIEAQRAYYQNLIDQFARTYSGPVFVPHITVYSGTFASDLSPERILAQATSHLSPYTLQVDRLRYTELLTKSFFVQLHPSHLLQNFSETLRAQALPPANYQLDPHLSLLYQHLPEADKQHLAISIQLHGPHITFDEISVITSPIPTRSPGDVAQWQEVYRQKLSTLS